MADALLVHRITVSRKIMISSFIGNALEWFDFAIFGYLTSVFGKLFFPNLDPYAALLSSYSVFAASFVMRPIGAILFGHLGDKWGRKKALIWSLGCMAIPTMLIGLLPQYEQIGLYAPLCLFICRMVQGLSIGGEFSGSIILLAEHAPPHRKGFFSIWADMGSLIGMIAASLTILLLNACLTEFELLAWGWRVPFIASFLIAIIGYRLRHHLMETPEFLAQKNKRMTSWPIISIFKKYKQQLFLAVFFLMINSAGFYILIIFIPSHPLNGYSKLYGFMITLFSLFIMMPAMIWGAIMSDKIGQVRCLIIGYLGCLILALPLIYYVKYGTFLQQMLYQGLFATSLGFCFGPRCSFAAQLFPTAVRYSAVAISYNISNALFGGTAPLICALLVEQTNSTLAPAGYLVMASVLSIVSVILLSRNLSAQKLGASKNYSDQIYIPDYKIRTPQILSHSQSCPEYLKQRTF